MYTYVVVGKTLYGYWPIQSNRTYIYKPFTSYLSFRALSSLAYYIRSGLLSAAWGPAQRLAIGAFCSPLLISSVVMAPLSTTPNSQPLVPSFLRQSPKRWSSKDLQMLMLTEQFDLPAEELIEAVYLPTDDLSQSAQSELTDNRR